jgi:hypothetical protein
MIVPGQRKFQSSPGARENGTLTTGVRIKRMASAVLGHIEESRHKRS